MYVLIRITFPKSTNLNNQVPMAKLRVPISLKNVPKKNLNVSKSFKCSLYVKNKPNMFKAFRHI
jgi:IS30 family transposase